MLADLFTKPLQGQLFHYLRDLITAYIPMQEILEEIGFSTKEHVGKREKNHYMPSVESPHTDMPTRKNETAQEQEHILPN